MVEVMGRAARRRAAREAAKAGKGRPMVRVRNEIAVVPMEHIETYYQHEIINEGRWASGRRPIIVRPKEDGGWPADAPWFARTLEAMRETRRRNGTLPVTIDMADGTTPEIDIGLIDVTVFFDTPPGCPALPETQEAFDVTYRENFRHFDSVCAGALHDQMIIAGVPHLFRTDGTHLFHYHNLIFGLRQEIRGDMAILNPLDAGPLLETFKRTGRIAVIGGQRPDIDPVRPAASRH